VAIIRTLGPRLKLLVSDVQMPKLDGLTLAGMIRAEFPRIPIILISGNPEVLRRGSQQRQFEFVQKPFHLETLLNAVRTVMRSRELRARTMDTWSSDGATPSRI
jgi:two-component system cell cycle sensor histidine kinase/response regulator CckA